MKNATGKFYTRLISKNFDGLVSFIEQMTTFDGKVNFRYLHRVRESRGKITVSSCSERDRNNDYAIVIGGEVPNSFCPLYEAAYFFEALFLSALGTAYLNRYGAKTTNAPTKEKIAENIGRITEEEMQKCVRNPAINIISSLDTDIEPYRYVKHQLWRLDPIAFKKRCSDIGKGEFGRGRLDKSLRGVYWVDKDEELALEAIKYAETLPAAKAIQYYRSIEEILGMLEIDIANIPWYFNFVPKEEILLLGPNNEFLKAVIALHDEKVRTLLSRITRTDHPWIISLSCPACSESSKKIISATLKADCKTIHLVCSDHPHEFRNELGTKIIRKGCGHRWDVKVPRDSKELYALFKEKSPTLNFAVRYLLAVIRTTADCPVCWPVTELGVVRRRGRYVVRRDSPKGYGDHINLLTSLLAMQHLFVRRMIVPEFTRSLANRHLLTSREMQILSWANTTKLFDPDVVCKDNKRIHVVDTSVFKALEKELSASELFKRSIDLNDLKLESLLGTQGRTLADILK